MLQASQSAVDHRRRSRITGARSDCMAAQGGGVATHEGSTHGIEGGGLASGVEAVIEVVPMGGIRLHDRTRGKLMAELLVDRSRIERSPARWRRFC